MAQKLRRGWADMIQVLANEIGVPGHVRAGYEARCGKRTFIALPANLPTPIAGTQPVVFDVGRCRNSDESPFFPRDVAINGSQIALPDRGIELVGVWPVNTGGAPHIARGLNLWRLFQAGQAVIAARQRAFTASGYRQTCRQCRKVFPRHCPPLSFVM